MLAEVAATEATTTRRRKAVSHFSPSFTKGNNGGKPKRPKLCHEDYCFNCSDGGDLLECSVCPKVYHATAACAGLESDGAVPLGLWHCPWHSCWECGRKSSTAGGVLFHCVSCPTTYCFDCCPDSYTAQPQGTARHQRLQASLQSRGIKSSPKSFMFFTCDGCSSSSSSAATPGGGSSSGSSTAATTGGSSSSSSTTTTGGSGGSGGTKEYIVLDDSDEDDAVDQNGKAEDDDMGEEVVVVDDDDEEDDEKNEEEDEEENEEDEDDEDEDEDEDDEEEFLDKGSCASKGAKRGPYAKKPRSSEKAAAVVDISDSP
jgi:hypothetical protein